jgi:hypothetical protein
MSVKLSLDVVAGKVGQVAVSKVEPVGTEKEAVVPAAVPAAVPLMVPVGNITVRVRGVSGAKSMQLGPAVLPAGKKLAPVAE